MNQPLDVARQGGLPGIVVRAGQCLAAQPDPLLIRFCHNQVRSDSFRFVGGPSMIGPDIFQSPFAEGRGPLSVLKIATGPVG
ncbi:MAG: hypothetical protein PHQ87_14090, partial [Hydrogenophaga sp.]|uniref:hypothetical protein n=1 Tax=Hydrogenophaga sp. TaxID=1904254 RepID=UPI0026386340